MMKHEQRGEADRARGGMTRRAALRQAALAAGALAATTSVGALAAAAGPTGAGGVTTVYFEINWQQNWDLTAQKLVQEYVDQTFNSLHKGLRAIPTNQQGASGILAQVLAGDPHMPATVTSCCSDFAVARPMLAKLDPWLSKDNLSASLWSSGQLSSYQEPSGLYAVPAYTAPQPLIYNQTLFDDLGLKYPDPEWDYIEATKVWKSLTGTNRQGQHRYGTTFQWQPNSFDGSRFLLKGFGGDELDATRTRCLLDSKQSIAAGEWIYGQIWDKVIINRFGLSGNGAQDIIADQVGMYQSAGNMLFEAVTTLGTNVKWDVLPMPSWPVRRATNVNVDYFGMNAYYPNQDVAWELFKYVAANPAYQRFIISTTLMFPNLMSLWSEWERDINAAAPITRGKQLQWWPDAALKGYGYGRGFWRYDPAAVFQTLDNGIQPIWDRKMSVVEGFTLLTSQVNAIESVGASTAAAEAAIVRGLASTSHGRYTTAPSTTGAGTAARPAGSRVTVVSPNVTLLGDGTGIGATGEGSVFAGSPFMLVDGSLTCRLDSMRLAAGAHLSQWAMAGLMVRSDLSDLAPLALLAVTAGDGLIVLSRSIQMPQEIVGAPVQQLGQQGLLAQKELTTYPAPGRGNLLTRPVWLRLTRSGTTWRGATSFDGSSWTPAGAPITVEMAAVWAGVFATANNPAAATPGSIGATFSNVSVPVTQRAQIGQP